ncbi:MAG: hypothetical protein QNJ98_18905 [Planctomycetota bacterium]|nr:hypothetical protein [Planctomycetota bacterium]
MGSDRLLLVLALALAGLGLVALLSDEDGAEDPVDALPADGASAEAPAAELEGRGNGAARPPVIPPGKEVRVSPEELKKRWLGTMDEEFQKRWKDRVELRGIVVDHAGRPAAAADVYQLPDHERAGSVGGRWMPRTQSDGAGRFTILALKPLAESIFVARTKDGAPGWVPGSDVAPGATIRIVLPEPTQLDVYLVDTQGKPLPNEGVRVVPLTARGMARRFPGPETPMPEQYDATDENGRVRFAFPRSVPVMVIPSLDGWVADPQERWLPDSMGSVSFTVQKGATLIVKAVDAASGKTIGQTVWASVLDRETGRELTAGSSTDANGVLRSDLPLLPGFYDVLVTMRDREPTLLQDVRVAEAGAEVEITARMGPLKKAATLSLILPPPPPRDTDGRKTRGRGRVAPIVFAKRLDGGFERHGWVRRVDAKRDRNRPDRFTLTMRPGPYEVVVMNPNTAYVGHLRNLTLAAGSERTRRVPMEPGVQFALHEVLPADVHVRSVWIEVAGVGRFPPVGYDARLAGGLRAWGGLVNNLAAAGSSARKNAGAGPVLGPFPGSAVTVEVVDWEGGTNRYTVRAR